MAEIHTRTPVLAEDTELGVGRLTGDIVEVIIIIVKPWPQTPTKTQTGLMLTLKSCGPPTSPTFLQSMRIT